MAQLIDTSVFVAFERNQVDPGMLAHTMPGESLALAAVTAAELLTGVHRADSESRRYQRHAFVERILATVPVIPFDLSVARVYARLLAELRASGQMLGAHDLQIAATAVSRDWALVTYDVRDFQRVPGLVVQQASSPH